MLWSTREEAARNRRKGEITAPVQVHAVPGTVCLYSDGTILPPYPHTCGQKLALKYQNQWTGRKGNTK